MISLHWLLASCVLVDVPLMNDISVTRLEKRAWTQDTIEAVESLAASRGAWGREMLGDELLRCDVLYLATGEARPTAFLLVARVRLPVGAERLDARYLGLGAAQDEASAGAVMARFTADVRADEKRRRTRLVLFTTAVVSLAAFTAPATWTALQPGPDASLFAELLPVRDAARAWIPACGDRLLFHCSRSPGVRGAPAHAA